MTTVVVSLMWSASLLLLFAVSHVRLQCDSGASFSAQCGNVGRRERTFNNIILEHQEYMSCPKGLLAKKISCPSGGS